MDEVLFDTEALTIRFGNRVPRAVCRLCLRDKLRGYRSAVASSTVPEIARRNLATTSFLQYFRKVSRKSLRRNGSRDLKWRGGSIAAIYNLGKNLAEMENKLKAR